MTDRPLAVIAAETPLRARSSVLPEPFASRMAGREKRPLGDQFGLSNFGVNLTRIHPGGVSSLQHRHLTQDEFVFVLEGRPTLVTDSGEVELSPGMCAGFAKKGISHCLQNRTSEDVVYLEIGDRTPGDIGTYPADDLEARLDAEGHWRFTHKDGTPY